MNLAGLEDCMFKVMSVFGTRPEAIKMAPVILGLQEAARDVESLVCVTAQHRVMLDQVLDWFEIRPDYDLNLMRPDQGLSEFAASALTAISAVLGRESPDVVLVQGDTTTTIAAAMAASYHRIPVGHVEAGLRTLDRYSPFPEEINRRVVSTLSTYHFAPTDRAATSLRMEGISEDAIHVTGNTIVDALHLTASRPVSLTLDFDCGSRSLILVTAHRRENFGTPLESVCLAALELARRNQDVEIVFPLHLNPNIRNTAIRILSGKERIHLIEPLSYEKFIHLMKKATLIMTDSGGIQEEATVLDKPTLVMRNTTERPEAIEWGTSILVGTAKERIVYEAERLLRDPIAYRAMAPVGSPFGDGKSAQRIINALIESRH